MGGWVGGSMVWGTVSVAGFAFVGMRIVSGDPWAVVAVRALDGL